MKFLVVNAQHMKALPGDKTDVKDAEWIAQLLRQGLLKPSYIPNETNESYESSFVVDEVLLRRARQLNRIQKVLEGANIKLGSVVTDIMGVSANDMLQSIADGEDDPEKIANLARHTMKKKKRT